MLMKGAPSRSAPPSLECAQEVSSRGRRPIRGRRCARPLPRPVGAPRRRGGGPLPDRAGPCLWWVCGHGARATRSLGVVPDRGTSTSLPWDAQPTVRSYGGHRRAGTSRRTRRAHRVVPCLPPVGRLARARRSGAPSRLPGGDLLGTARQRVR